MFPLVSSSVIQHSHEGASSFLLFSGLPPCTALFGTPEDPPFQQSSRSAESHSTPGGVFEKFPTVPKNLLDVPAFLMTNFGPTISPRPHQETRRLNMSLPRNLFLLFPVPLFDTTRAVLRTWPFPFSVGVVVACPTPLGLGLLRFGCRYPPFSDNFSQTLRRSGGSSAVIFEFSSHVSSPAKAFLSIAFE